MRFQPQANLELSHTGEPGIKRKKTEIDYWNKNLWKWRYYVWILRKMRKFKKSPNKADDRVCEELNNLSRISDRPLNVVDLCCGDGSSLTKKLLKNKKLKIIGIDISRECAKTSEVFKAGGFECVTADCECSPIRNDAIDVAIVRNSLHHLTNLQGFVREVNRIMSRDSALLIVEVETKSKISNFVYHNILSEPNYPFVKQDEIILYLEEQGFTVNKFASLRVDKRLSFFISAIKRETVVPLSG